MESRTGDINEQDLRLGRNFTGTVALRTAKYLLFQTVHISSNEFKLSKLLRPVLLKERQNFSALKWRKFRLITMRDEGLEAARGNWKVEVTKS